MDAPCWKLSWAGNVHFTSKYVGQAFFPCSCRSYPMEVFCKYPNYLIGKQIFYRCPYLNTAVGADQPPEVSELVQQMGIDMDEAAMAMHIARGYGMWAGTPWLVSKRVVWIRQHKYLTLVASISVCSHLLKVFLTMIWV